MSKEPVQLPLKGFTGVWGKTKRGETITITGLGDGRYKLKLAIRQPEPK